MLLRKEDRTTLRSSVVGFLSLLLELTVIDQFPLLYGIAYYDDTIFNQRQMKFLAVEAAGLRAMIEGGSAGILPGPKEDFTASLDELIDFATEGQGRPGHQFLWIIGL